MKAGQLAPVVGHPDAAEWDVVVAGHGRVAAVTRASLTTGRRALVLYVEDAPTATPPELAPVLA